METRGERTTGKVRLSADTVRDAAAPPGADSIDRLLSEASARGPRRPRWWRDARRRRLLALADLIAVALAVAAAVPSERAVWLLAFVPVWILIAKLSGLYDADHRSMRHLTVDEAPTIAAWAVISTTLRACSGS